MHRAMKIPAAFLALVLLLGAADAVQAGVTGPTRPESESVRMLLPSPGELFVSLGRLGDVDWSDAASYNPRYDYKDNAYRALNLGVRSADGFLAIQARDKKNLGKMFQSIVTLAEELMVRDTVLDQGREVEKLAREGKWDKVHLELGKLRTAIMDEMENMGDSNVALLVSAGGWLEGLRATSKVLAANYNPEMSTILYQPQLVNYFAYRMIRLDKGSRNNPVVRNLTASLTEIKELIDVGYKNPVPRENIVKLLEISTKLVKEIEKG